MHVESLWDSAGMRVRCLCVIEVRRNCVVKMGNVMGDTIEHQV